MAEHTEPPAHAVILVGHGGLPKDCPPDLVMRLKALEGQRRTTGGAPTVQELELDARIRQWPRTPETDPYQAGLEALAGYLRPHLNGATLVVAYNEFCSPTLEEAVADVIAVGATSIAVVPSMLTPGGVHAEVEIPETLQRLRACYPQADFRYVWPVDLALVAGMLAEQLRRRD
jgi:sirohydrochlorin cobaltochelatase